MGNNECESHDTRILFRHVGCPYCERVVRVAEDLELEFQSRFVVPTHSQRSIVKRVSGQRGVPVLVDPERGTTMAESADIVTYLEANYGPGSENSDSAGGDS